MHGLERLGPLAPEQLEDTPPPRRRRRRLFEGCLWLVCLFAIAVTVGAVHDRLVPTGPRWLRAVPSVPCLFGDPFGGRRTLALLLVGTDQEGRLTDTIIVALIDRKTKRIGLLSFPRDLYVKTPDGPSCKINEVLSRHMNGKRDLKQGLAYLVKTIRQDFGIAVDGYARIDVKAFQQVVDAVGGVDLTVPKGPTGNGLHYRDSSQNLHIDLKPGPQHLNGYQAMGFVRWRQDNAHRGDGDIGRTQRQQAFLKAVTAKVAERMKASKLAATKTAVEMAGIAYRNVTTDLSLSQVQAIASMAREVDRGGLVAKTVPTGPGRMARGMFIFDPDPSATQAAVKEILAQLAVEKTP